MKTLLALTLSALLSIQAVSQHVKSGKWLDTTKDSTDANSHYIMMTSNGKLLITEDYEVLKTHEICGSLYGVFLEDSQLGRYTVNFKGLRTSSSFTFTTQYDAEKWIEKWCTPESLWSITAGHGEMKRSY